MPVPSWLDAVLSPVLRTTRARGAEDLTGELLRQWNASEVWRLSFGLRSVVVKRATGNQYGEAAAYERFVVPLDLRAPEVIHLERLDDAAILVLTDVGRTTLEQEPSADGFLAAAEVLAEVRSKPVEQPSEFGPDRLRELLSTVEQLGDPLREELAERAVPALAEVHREAPVGVVHGDFVPKNLVTDGTRWTLVDWPGAYAAPQLADLYTLTREAVAVGHDPVPVVRRYLDASGNDPALVRQQSTIGGICFALLALAWIQADGARTVPGSRAWVPGLLAELAELTAKLR